MDNSLDQFKGDVLKSSELVDKLRERVFSKGKIDVVYSDFQNWERYGILFKDKDAPEGKWNKLNYIEYFWLNIVGELRSFGFSYETIKKIKNKWMAYVPPEEILKGIINRLEGIKKIKPEAAVQIKETIKDNKKRATLLSQLENYMTVIELMIHDIILNNEHAMLHINADGEVLPFTESYSKFNPDYEPDKKDFIKHSHVCISLTDILNKFLIKDKVQPRSLNKEVVSDNEHELLRIIRSRTNELVSIRISLKNGEFDLIEMTEHTKVTAESRLIDHIKKGEYQDIKFKTQNGKIVFFENTRKHKLNN